jgi:uncharacterized integral membrane protein (TIGR00698 family)
MSVKTVQKIVFWLLLLACLTPWVTPPFALLLGLLASLGLIHPFRARNKQVSTWLLQIAIIGLGFGMPAREVLTVGPQAVALTVVSLALTLGLGWLLGRIFKVPAKLAYLLSVGTAICGGSAIAAVAPVIAADETDISLALATVFLLNALALFLFPWVGEALQLTQAQFGLWAALAIHDTSSVVGAGARFGEEALRIATAVKLQRALWIVPLTLVSAWALRRKDAPIKWPWFIGGFVLAVLAHTLWGDAGGLFPLMAKGAKQLMTVTLFLIGAGLTREMLMRLSVRPLVMGATLWLVVSGAALWVVRG